MSSLAAAIAPQLPYLRRYARAMSGSQSAGDAMVAAVLESVIADGSTFPKASSDKVGLYKLFAAMVTTVAPKHGARESQGLEATIAANLAALSPPERQAFLLVSVEGFSREETAEILDLATDEVGRLLASASEEISRQLATDVMIIEDEPMIAMDLEEIAESLGHRVVGVARTRNEAQELFQSSSPRLVLADIQLADGSSGIDAVNDILTATEIPVIFITAFPERLLTGERPEPTFLVTKPFMPDMIKALIGQALFFDRRAHAAA